jgi:hypothetical protein
MISTVVPYCYNTAGWDEATGSTRSSTAGGLGRGQLAGDQGQDLVRSAGQDEIRCLRGAQPGGDRTAGHLDDGGAAVGPQLDRDRRAVGLAVLQEQRGREGEPVTSELVAVDGGDHELDPPTGDGLDDRQQ